MRFLAVLFIALTVLAQEPPPVPTDPPPPPTTLADEQFTRFVFFGKKFADLGEHASAYEQFAKADALKPDQPAVLYNMAVVLARAGKYSESQVKVDRYLQLFPAGEEKANVTKLQLELEFQRELQKKRQLDQEYADLFNRGKFLYGRGELANALASFQQAEQLRPDDAAAVFNEAVIHEKLGDYAKAIERFRRYAEVEGDIERRGGIDERIYGLQHELDDMRTKIVCAFCGRKLPAGATWCERCWHGPYLVKSAVWNSRPCVEGASATRTTYFSDERFNNNDSLPCLWKNGTMLDALRYTPSRQRAIQDARKAEGWTYGADGLQGWSDKQGNQVRYTQGADYLERVTSTGGEILTYAAHANGGVWLLDREDLIIDGQKYVNHYTYDAAGRIAQQRVDYQNTNACNHLIGVTADYTYSADDLMSVTLNGGYEGFVPEGSPKTEWQATVSYTYDDKARVSKEELAVTSFAKMYQQKPQGALRDDINRLFTGGARVKKPIETMLRTGDPCASAGSQILSNPIDLRPFYPLSPNLAIALQNGVTKAVVAFTYPDSYTLKK